MIGGSGRTLRLFYIKPRPAGIFRRADPFPRRSWFFKKVPGREEAGISRQIKGKIEKNIIKPIEIRYICNAFVTHYMVYCTIQ